MSLQANKSIKDIRGNTKNSFYFTDINLKHEDENFYIDGTASSINTDLGNDSITEDCLSQMADMINTGNVKLGFDHTELLGGSANTEAVGRVTEAKVENGRLKVRGLLDKTFSHFSEIKNKIKNKFLDGLSIEYQVDPSKTIENFKEGVRHRVIGGLKSLIGIALTPRPMNTDSYFDYYVKHIEVKEMSEETKEETTETTQEEEKEEAPAEDATEAAAETTEEAPAEEATEEKKEEEEGEAPVETKSVDYEAIGKKVHAEQQKAAKVAEMKSAAMEAIKSEMKNFKEPYLNPEAKFAEQGGPITAELKRWREILKDPKADVELKYQAAAELHNSLHPYGITKRMAGSSEYKKAGKTFNATGGNMSDLEVKSFEYKAQLEHDTTKVADADYYQNAAELNDIYDPVIVSHLNDKTTLWGLMRKKNVSNIGSDKYGFRFWRTRIEGIGGNDTTYNYDEGDALTGYHSPMLKAQNPFMQYGVTVQVSGLTIAETRGAVGDIFALQVQRATADLLRGINADLYGTAVGFTDGGKITGLEVFGDDGGTYANLYGHARATYTTLKGTDDAQSNTPNISKTLLRTALRTVEKNGANRGSLMIVCDQIQRDKILGLLDPAQRFNATSARAGFEGMPTFDGIPIHSDDQCNDGYVYVIPTDSYYAAVLLAPTFEDLAKTDDSKKGFIKTYFTVVAENPNYIYKITGLNTS
ncbi:MAG: hypothetical protein CL811_06330 [Colwelliaceae bacterium]|jgi:hypothetical protein|nr:hypothetical protein [Colwelliaceae bacterium]|tara:strand:+ start:6508 stop:8607 length:2100 start_codon:yes stop_codon:yes gene_type:complete